MMFVVRTEFQVLNPSGGKGIYGKVRFRNRAIGVLPLDESGNTYGVASYSGSALYASLAQFSTASGATAVGFLDTTTASGGLSFLQNDVATQLNKIGSSINFVNNETTYNNNNIDAFFIRNLPHLVGDLLFVVVDHKICAQLASLRHLRFIPRGCNHAAV